MAKEAVVMSAARSWKRNQLESLDLIIRIGRKTAFIRERVSGGRPVVIDDIGLSAQRARALEATDTVRLYTATVLSAELLDGLGYEYPMPSVTIYVGRSGKTVRDHMGKLVGNEIFAHAQTWDRSSSHPLVTTSAIEWTPFVDTYIGEVLVVDDVISTGTTLEMLKERNAWRFPNALWYAAAWVTRKLTLKGYERLDAALHVTHPKGRRIPIISLSSLLGSRELAASWAQKHFFPDEGRKLLQALDAVAIENRCPG